MQPLAQPPRKEDSRFDDWVFRLWKRIATAAGLDWTIVDKTGSNLTDIETRHHKDLQYIPADPVMRFDSEPEQQIFIPPKNTYDFDHVTFPGKYSLGALSHIYTLQELMNHEWSAGVVDGCDLTDNANGTVSISSGIAVIRAVADGHTTLYGVAVAAQANIALTDDATNYVYLDYNAGSPQFAVSTAVTSFNCMDKCIAWVIHRSGTALHYIDAREQNVDSNRKMRQLFLKYARFIHAEGGTTLGSNGLAITLTSGSFYFMLAELVHDAFDTSVAGTANVNVFTLWTVAAGVWTETANSKVVSTTTYNDTTTGVQTLGNNKFGVTWFYVINDAPSELHAVMGQAEYANIADARVATPPVTIPSIVSGVGVLVGFVVYEKSNTVFNNVYSAFATSFTPGLATTHNGLSGLQGGTINEYYHFTLAQHTDLTDSGDSTLHYHASDRDSANFTGTNWTDLTDAGDSILHYHASDRALANTTGAGTGVLTALAVNVGTAGSVVVNGGALGTPTSGTLDACTTNTEVAGTNNTQLASTAHVFAERTNTATLTNKTLTSGLVTATLADNTATLGIADAKFVKSQIAADTNGHGHAQAVEMTYAASGSTGITVANNSNTDLGTSNFTLVWEGALPAWVPSVSNALFNQYLNATNNIWFYVATDGKLSFYAYLAGAYVIPISKSTVATGLVDGTTHQIVVSVVRETAGTAGSITFYIDGVQLGTSVSITAAATTSLTIAAAILYISGTQAARFASVNKAAYTLNRAITAAEALSIYRNGLAYADKFGSQTELLTNGGFTGSATGWTLGTGWAYGTNNVVATAATGDLSQFVLAPNKRYRVTFTLSGYTSGSVKVVYGVVNASGADRSANGTYTEEYATPYNASTTLALRPTTFSGTIDDVSCVQIGATLALEPEGIQPNQWHDSANNLHASYPSAGASLTRWKETGLYEWTTAITADTTLTSIVPAGYELEKIVFKNSTTNAVSVRLGTTAGGTDIFGLTALNISTTLGGYKTVLCNQGFSTTAAQTLYLSSTAWASASLTFTMYFRRMS